MSDGGLLDDVIRRVAWPKLVGIDRYTDPAVTENQGATSDLIFKPNSSGIPSLKEMDQVQRDGRSNVLLIYFPIIDCSH